MNKINQHHNTKSKIVNHRHPFNVNSQITPHYNPQQQPNQQTNKKNTMNKDIINKDISRFIDIDRINIYRNNEKQNYYNNKNQVNRHPQGLYVNNIKDPTPDKIILNRVVDSNINDQLLSRNFNFNNQINNNYNHYSNAIQNNEKIQYMSYNNMTTNDTRTRSNQRLTQLGPLASTKKFPIVKDVPFFDMKPVGTRNISNNTSNNTQLQSQSYGDILKNFDKPLSQRI